MNNTANPFQSFWMAGYECSDKLDARRQRVDFINITGHLQLINQDYEDLKAFHIKTVREGIRWSFVETAPYQYDWRTVEVMIEAGRRHQIQQLWDICHFGYPDGLTPFDAEFTPRFVAICRAFVQLYRRIRPDDVLIVTPINEVSFISWLGGETGGTSPYCFKQGWEVKYALMRAYIQGVAAMQAIDPNIRIMTTEPLVNMVPPANATEQDIADAQYAHSLQYQTVDMLSGRMCPELGGKPEYADILGFNYYYNNQWIINDGGFLPWIDNDDKRWRPLRDLLTEAYQRYNRPIVITETSHSGEDRHHWMNMIGEHSAALLAHDIPLLGVCLYPIIDRPDWNDLSDWHHSGLWDAPLPLPDNGLPERVLNQAYATALLNAQVRVSQAQKTDGHHQAGNKFIQPASSNGEVL